MLKDEFKELYKVKGNKLYIRENKPDKSILTKINENIFEKSPWIEITKYIDSTIEIENNGTSVLDLSDNEKKIISSMEKSISDKLKQAITTNVPYKDIVEILKKKYITYYFY